MTISRSKKINSLLFFSGLGVALPALFLYWQTSYPSVAYIDSGELAVVNWTLGIAHPTGYPLYTLIGRLFALLPLELIRTQILLGTLCTTAAVVIIAVVSGLAPRRTACLQTSFLFAACDLTPLQHNLWDAFLLASFGLLLAASPLLWHKVSPTRFTVCIWSFWHCCCISSCTHTQIAT